MNGKGLFLGALVSGFVSRGAAADPAAAEAVFREGRQLIEQGRTAEACDKFAESHRLEPSSGALFNLAVCHADLGKTATAWAEFLSAARLSRAQQQPERADEAQRRATEMEPALMRLTVQVPMPVAGLAVTRDGESLSSTLFGTAIPVDPGTHVIHAVAPGRSAFSVELQLSEPGKTVVVNVPELLPSPPVVSPQGVRAHSARPRTKQLAAPKRSLPAAFWISGATGVAATAVGSVAGIFSLSNYENAESMCATHRQCNDSAMDTADRAQRQANVANVAFGVALVAAAVSVWLYVADAPERPSPR